MAISLRKEILSAVQSGDVAATQRLLVNATLEDLSEITMVHGAREYSALMIAADRNDMTMVELLLRSGALVDQFNKQGTTALMIASSRGYNSIIQALLQANADVNTKNKDGETAVMIASRLGHTFAAQLLLGRDARRDSTSSSPGPSPLPAATSSVSVRSPKQRAQRAAAKAVLAQGYTVISPTLPHISGAYHRATLSSAASATAVHVFERQSDRLYVLRSDPSGLWEIWDRSLDRCIARAKKVSDLPDTGSPWTCLVGEKFTTCYGMTVKAESAQVSSSLARLSATASLDTRNLFKMLHAKGKKAKPTSSIASAKGTRLTIGTASGAAAGIAPVAVTTECAPVQHPEDWESDAAILASLDCDDDDDAELPVRAVAATAQSANHAQFSREPPSMSATEEQEVQMTTSRKRAFSDCDDAEACAQKAVNCPPASSNVIYTPPASPRPAADFHTISDPAAESAVGSPLQDIASPGASSGANSPYWRTRAGSEDSAATMSDAEQDMPSVPESPASPAAAAASPESAAPAGNKRARVYRWGEWIGGTAERAVAPWGVVTTQRSAQVGEVIDLTDD